MTPASSGTAAPMVLDIPIGLAATGTRREFDSLGQVEVAADRYWGAQTQRSLQHFNIGHDRMPKEVYHAYGYVKKAAAVRWCAAVNAEGSFGHWQFKMARSVGEVNQLIADAHAVASR